MKTKKIIKWLNGELSSKEIEDLKQSEGFGTLEKIAHYASHLKPKVDAQAALAAFKTKSLRKETKVRTLNFKTFFKVAAVLAVLLTSSYFLFFNNTHLKTGIAQTKTFRLPDNSKFY
jgi:ferric-dicitrate binding protein FerR (iron transport regulator)